MMSLRAKRSNLAPRHQIASACCARLAMTTRSAADAGDVGAAGDQLVLEALKAAVEVIDAVDHGLTFRREAGDDQRHRSAQVGRHHGRALEAVDAFDGGGLAIEVDA